MNDEEQKARWICPKCGGMRDVPSKHVGAGTPACPTCGIEMVRENPQGFELHDPIRPTTATILGFIDRKDPDLMGEREDGSDQ